MLLYHTGLYLICMFWFGETNAQLRCNNCSGQNKIQMSENMVYMFLQAFYPTREFGFNG